MRCATVHLTGVERRAVPTLDPDEHLSIARPLPASAVSGYRELDLVDPGEVSGRWLRHDAMGPAHEDQRHLSRTCSSASGEILVEALFLALH